LQDCLSDGSLQKAEIDYRTKLPNDQVQPSNLVDTIIETVQDQGSRELFEILKNCQKFNVTKGGSKPIEDIRSMDRQLDVIETKIYNWIT